MKIGTVWLKKNSKDNKYTFTIKYDEKIHLSDSGQKEIIGIIPPLNNDKRGTRIKKTSFDNDSC